MSGHQKLKWAVVIVNWNNWGDTLECLEGVMRMDGFQSPVILVDNASTDDSVERFLQWTKGELSIIPESRDIAVSSLVNPPVKKPVHVTCIDAGGSENPDSFNKNPSHFYLIRAQANDGFAAGNNIGIRFALDFLECDTFWLINNDAVPQQDAFEQLNQAFKVTNPPTLCGTAIMDYFAPEKVQSCGGIFNFYTGLASHKFDGQDQKFLIKQPDLVMSTYPVGASLVVHKDFIASAGLMDETLFLYYEELSWMVRKGPPFQAQIATRALVFHKGSSSTGFSQSLLDRNALADYYIIRNRLLIGRQLGIFSFFIYIATTFVGIFKRLASGRLELVFGGFKASTDGILGRRGRG